MLVSGISSSNLMDYSTRSIQNRMQQFRQEFQQLGADLQSGNLSAAQADFTQLKQRGPQNNSTSQTQSNDPIAQAFNQLAQDLQSGNISAAQQDYRAIQQDFQNQKTQVHHHRVHHGGGGNGSTGISQLLSQLD